MKKPRRLDRLAYKAIGNETIILDTKINKEVHQLNEVASFVWNLCDGEHDFDSIVREVYKEFEVEENCASLDVQLLIAELSNKSLLVDNNG